MRFNLVDQIVELIPGKRIQAVKNLTLGEEYLADHFPTFPVMPGVLMLEALVQTAAWLLRVTDQFSHSMVVLREVKGVKYGNFVEPGKQLQLNVEIDERNTQTTDHIAFRGSGEVEGVLAVAGRFVLERYNLRTRNAELAGLDDQLIEHYRQLYATLTAGAQEAVGGYK